MEEVRQDVQLDWIIEQFPQLLVQGRRVPDMFTYPGGVEFKQDMLLEK